MVKQRGTNDFHDKWLLECAIERTGRDVDTSKPISNVCTFCKLFGKEDPQEGVPRKRKRSQNIQLFKRLRRADKMKDHNRLMHNLNWQEYQSLNNMGKKTYFQDKAPPPVNSILRSFHRQDEQRIVFGDRDIVEVLVDDLLFSPKNKHDSHACKSDAESTQASLVTLHQFLNWLKSRVAIMKSTVENYTKLLYQTCINMIMLLKWWVVDCRFDKPRM